MLQVDKLLGRTNGKHGQTGLRPTTHKPVPTLLGTRNNLSQESEVIKVLYV